MTRIDNRLPQFMPDFLVSWDFDDKDAPCVCISRVRRDKHRLTADTIGVSFEKCGVVSLRQILEECEAKERKEAERAKNLAEFRRKVFHADDPETEG